MAAHKQARTEIDELGRMASEFGVAGAIMRRGLQHGSF